MKYIISIVCLAGLVMIVSILLFACVAAPETKEIDLEKVAVPDWDAPIAPGVYYPHYDEVPEHPVRYYRVRCWPGCHSGSTHGKYPDRKLNYSPVFMTSTIDNLELEEE